MQTIVYLRKDLYGWSLYSEQDVKITGPVRHTDEWAAMRWAERFVECWGWTVHLHEDNECEKSST